jgi:hypothetical protein
VEGVNGRFFYKNKERKGPRKSYDEATAKKLWEISEKLTGLN